jgi:phospholipid/cholesterol/gamma-HCH transport system permease protein
MFFGIGGGYFIGWATDVITIAKYQLGIQYWFVPYYITYSIVKSMVFAFLIVSISSYFGYNVRGGALQVGKASTDSVVTSSVLILAADLLLTHLMLNG